MEYIKKAGFQFVKNKGSNRSFIASRKDTSIERMKYLRSISRFLPKSSLLILKLVN